MHKPAPVTVAQLAALPSQTVAVEFGTSKGPERHTETGTPLAGVIDRAELALAAGRHNDQLAFGIDVIGADGHHALVSYGELSAPGGRTVLLATTEDGRPLARPRLVLPGDAKGGRYVSDVVELRVVRP